MIVSSARYRETKPLMQPRDQIALAGAPRTAGRCTRTALCRCCAVHRVLGGRLVAAAILAAWPSTTPRSPGRYHRIQGRSAYRHPQLVLAYALKASKVAQLLGVWRFWANRPGREGDVTAASRGERLPRTRPSASVSAYAPAPRALRLAYLTTQYPAVSHTFIRRELVELERRGHHVLRLAIRRAADHYLTQPTAPSNLRRCIVWHSLWSRW